MPRKPSPPRKPQPVTPERQFQMSTGELLAHLEKHFPLTTDFERQQACKSILEAAKERGRLRTPGVYDVTDVARPRFVDRVCYGGYWKQGKDQARWITRNSGSGKRGRPPTQDADLFFVSMLATQFSRLSGKPSSANYENPTHYTDFGRFAGPLLISAGIRNPRNALKAFLKARNSLHKSP
jgi:hypothetical protein